MRLTLKPQKDGLGFVHLLFGQACHSAPQFGFAVSRFDFERL